MSHRVSVEPFAATLEQRVKMERMKHGWARVSFDEQNPALQHAALKKAVSAVFEDEGLWGAMTKRPALLRCLKKLGHGDTLIV